MLIKKSILRSLGDQSWGFQVSCEATASEYWELSEQDGPFLLWSVCAWRWGLSQLKPVSWHIWVTEAWENLNCKVLRHFILEVWTECYSWLFFFFFFKCHRNRNEATLSHSGFLQHMHCPFHYSWCVFTDSALNHEEYSCLSFPKRALWNERTCTWGAHTKKKPVLIWFWRKSHVVDYAALIEDGKSSYGWLTHGAFPV